MEHPEGLHIVSFDDDVPEVFEKVRPGTSTDTMQPLPPGSLAACRECRPRVTMIGGDQRLFRPRFRANRAVYLLRTGRVSLQEAIIHHARDLMHQEGCYIWGLAPSANPMNLVVNRISRRNGMVNGFAYGYLNRHDPQFQSLYCSPTEDVERSCRFYESRLVKEI